MIRRMCDFFTSILVAGVLYSGCLTPELAIAQNSTCATRPTGDNSNACATTAFVNNEISSFGVGSIANVAALRALAAPVSASTVYVTGYLTPGDGGEGWITYNTSSSAADNGGTIFRPNSLPATGRWLRDFASERGGSINVRWFGAACGAAIGTNNTAIAAAVAVAQTTSGSNLYFPACPTGAVYLGNISIQDGAVSILGDGGLGSALFGALNTNTIDLFSNSGCGNTHDWTINGMYIGASGTTGIGVHIKNAGWIGILNTRIDGPSAVKVECASQGVISNVQGYSSSGPALQIIAGGSNSGPIAVSGGQFTNNGGSAPAIDIVDPLGIVFNGVAYNVANGTATASIAVNGTASNTLGSVTFTEMHAESNYNTTSTMADYEIGKSSKAGSVKIYGGSSWGLGDGAHSQQDFVRLFDARNVVVDSTIASKLAGTGYTRSMIRVEAGYTGIFDFRNPIADVSGTTYSDATGKCAGTASCKSGGQIIDTLALGTPLPATSGGTGKATYAIGDLLYADTTTSLARLASVVAGTSVLIPGGIGIAPSWGKVAYGAIQNLGALSVMGRSANSSGVGADISATAASGGVLRESGGTIGFGTITGAGIAAGTVTLGNIATIGANTVLANATNLSASPGAFPMPSCDTSTKALQWTTNTGFVCNSSITANTATTATSATTATTATNATNTAITDDNSTNATMFPTWVTANTGNLPQKTSSTLMTWNPSVPQLKIGSGSDPSTIAGSSVYITNNGLSVFALRDSTNDIETYILSGTASLAGIMGTLTTHPFILRSNNLDRLTISSAGVFTFNTIPAADTAVTDNTLCVSTTGVILKGSGALGVCLGTSSSRYKHGIVNMSVGLAEIMRLNPKNFFYNKDMGHDENKQQYGFIAEDVVKVLPKLVGLDDKSRPNSVDMGAMIPIMVNAIKELKADNDNLRMDVLALQSKAKSNAK